MDWHNSGSEAPQGAGDEGPSLKKVTGADPQCVFHGETHLDKLVLTQRERAPTPPSHTVVVMSSHYSFMHNPYQDGAVMPHSRPTI